MDIIIFIGSVCLVVIAILFFIFAYKRKVTLDQVEQKKKKLQQDINILVQQLQNQSKDLQAINDLIKSSKNQVQYINRTINEKQQEHKKILKDIEEQKKKANNFYNQEKSIVEQQLNEFKKISSKAAENYFDTLQEAYKHADAAHAEKMSKLKEEQDSAAADLVNLRKTYESAHKALLKEQEVKENSDNYRLLPSSFDLNDIYSLEHIKSTLHKPRILSMLIWQTYFQPLAKEKFPIILQDKTKMGIYKITSLKTGNSYVGQSVDIYKRWMDHCKAGLGIDTPVGNKLYKAMQEEGLQNFTFELLCQCPREQLDKKEAYFISLYMSDVYGYNGTKGNK